MKESSTDREVERVDAAFNRVLAAEAAARASVADCRREAERRVAAAEEDARAILDRADARVRGVQRTADRHLREALAALLETPDDATVGELDLDTRARLDAVIALLADEMIGRASLLEPAHCVPARPS